MSWSYSGNPSASQKDAVRFLVGDTNTARQLATDEEIKWVLDTEANLYMAAALVCESVAARTGNVKSKSVGDLSITYGAEHYTGLAKTYRSRGASHQIPVLTGTSISGKDVQNDDDDQVQPRFKTNMHEVDGTDPDSLRD